MGWVGSWRPRTRGVAPPPPPAPGERCFSLHLLPQVKITTIMDYARMVKGEAALTSNVFSVTALVSDVVAIMAPKADAKGVEILVVPSPSAPHRLHGDSLRLLEVLCALMENAIQHSSAGGVVWLHLSTEGVVAGRWMMHFEIRDQGRGMCQSTLRSHSPPPSGRHPAPIPALSRAICTVNVVLSRTALKDSPRPTAIGW